MLKGDYASKHIFGETEWLLNMLKYYITRQRVRAR